MKAPRAAVRAAAIALVACTATGAGAQESTLPFDVCALLTRAAPSDLSGPVEELVRLGELTGRVPLRSRALVRASEAGGAACDRAAPPAASLDVAAARLDALPAQLDVWRNSQYPDDRNNGAVWGGRGLSASLEAGARVRYRWISAALSPVVTYQENLEFLMRPQLGPGMSEFANPYYLTIDLPQRFGYGSYVDVYPGDSYVRADTRWLSGGISTEGLWIGPAARNPILLSNTGPGFPHLFLATPHPIDLWFVDLELEAVLGRLSESDHFDSNPANDQNRIALLVAGIRPHGIDGLEFGVARSYVHDPDRDSPLYALLSFAADEPRGNEMTSFFARWVMAESGAEFYGEWARDERALDLTGDLLAEPAYSQAFMVGVQAVRPAGGVAVRLQAELTHLQEKMELRHGRPLPIYYTHPIIRQGHSHRGQLLGAGIGPGGDAQYVGVDVLFGRGMIGLFGERVRRNDASAEAVRARLDWPYSHDTELTGGVRATAFLGEFVLSGRLSHSQRWFRDFLRDEHGVDFTLEGRWLPRAR